MPLFFFSRIWRVVQFIEALSIAFLCTTECHFVASKADTKQDYTFSAIATTYDIEATTGAIGHFNFNNSASNMVLDVSPFADFGRVIESSLLNSWQYMIGVAVNDMLTITVFDLLNGTSSESVPLQGEAVRIHCTTTTCYGMDIDGHRMVSFDPFTGQMHTVFNYTGYEGVQGEAAFDRVNLVLYIILIDENAEAVPSAVDFKLHTITPINKNIGVGPFCFDSSLGLISLGSTLGGIVVLNTSQFLNLSSNHYGNSNMHENVLKRENQSQQITILRKESLGGIIGNNVVDCQDGILVASVDDWEQRGSPMLMLAFDFKAPKGGQIPIHNSTINIAIPVSKHTAYKPLQHAVHMLHIADCL